MIPKTANYPLGPARFMDRGEIVQILKPVDGVMRFVDIEVDRLHFGDAYYKPISIQDYEPYENNTPKLK